MVVYRLPPLELDRDGRPLGKHRYLPSAGELETELLTHVLHTDAAGMVSAAAVAYWKQGLENQSWRVYVCVAAMSAYDFILQFCSTLLPQRKALAEAMPVLSVALTHLERARLRFNNSGLPAAQALLPAVPGAAEAQPVDQPAEQVRGPGGLHTCQCCTLQKEFMLNNKACRMAMNCCC